jgi:glycosyltransferase involved in cell wall biosynthesis
VSAEGPPCVSIVIPFRNAAPHVSEALASLIDETAGGKCEVIAVDNGSTDGSAEIVRSFSRTLPLRIVESPNRANPSYARNAGVDASRGAKLLFVDADDAVAPGYVDAMRLALDGAPLVTSRVDSETLNPEWVRGAHGEPWQAEGVSVFFGFLPATGVNIGVRRDVFRELGGFSEHFAPCEDIALSWHAQLSLGVELQFVGQAVYRYRYRDSLLGLYRQAARWGRGNVRLYEHFKRSGMPGRTLGQGAAEWRGVTRGLLTAKSRAERAPLAVRLGYCSGRLRESLRRGLNFF